MEMAYKKKKKDFKVPQKKKDGGWFIDIKVQHYIVVVSVKGPHLCQDPVASRERQT